MTTVRAHARALTFLALALVLCTSVAFGDDPLRWKFTKGQKIHYTMTQKTTTKMEAQGQKLDTNMTQDIDMTWAVTDVDAAGNAEMDQTLDRIVFTMSGPAGEVKVDTSKEGEADAGPLGTVTKLFRAMAGNAFHMKMSARGDISDVKVPPKVLDAFKNAGPAAASNPMFSEDGLKRMINQASLVLPEEAVEKGHTWKAAKSFSMPPLGTIALDSNYTYEGPAGPYDRIGVTVKTEIKPAEGGPFEIKILAQDNKGGFRFDRKAGILRGSELTQKMTMQISVQGQEIVQEVDSTTKMDEKADSPK
jgi:hypothetical protein